MQRFLVPAVLTMVLAGKAQASSPTISEFQPLAFGEMTITGTTAETLVIAADGTESHGPNITPLLPGHNAVLRLTDFPVSTLVSVMADDSTLNRQPSGPSFDIGSYTFDPDASSQATDSNGQMTLKIGATLTTRASTTYVAGPYRGTYNVLVNY